MGLPSVTTTAAWSGTVIPEGEGMLVADGSEAFARHVVRLLRDRGLRAEMARKGRAAVEAHYCWDRQMQHLDGAIAAVASPPPAASASLEPVS
jgi:glycosyltransferase involved in cell wall biosynthesis